MLGIAHASSKRPRGAASSSDVQAVRALSQRNSWPKMAGHRNREQILNHPNNGSHRMGQRRIKLNARTGVCHSSVARIRPGPEVAIRSRTPGETGGKAEHPSNSRGTGRQRKGQRENFRVNTSTKGAGICGRQGSRDI